MMEGKDDGRRDDGREKEGNKEKRRHLEGEKRRFKKKEAYKQG